MSLSIQNGKGTELYLNASPIDATVIASGKNNPIFEKKETIKNCIRKL
jgi:hypothetical protein